jgi:hypothetical protein
MKTTLDLPDELVKEVKLLAVHEGKKLKDAVTDLLRKGLAAASGRSETTVKADKTMLAQRKQVARKFITGQWGTELAGYEAGRAADRKSSRERSQRWRS